MSEQQAKEPEAFYLMELHGENVKNLKCVTVQMGRDGIVVAGDNDNGKSNFLNLLDMLFLGAKGDGLMPIRNGCFRGEARGKVMTPDGELAFTITKEYETGKAPRFTVTDASGGAVKKPQEFLKTLYDALTFDVAEFLDPPGEKTPDGKNKKRVEILLRACPVSIDLDKAAADRKRLYDERTAVNRDLTNATSEAGLLQKKDVPERVDLDAKRAEIAAERAAAEEARRLGAAIERHDAELAALAAKYKALKADREAVAAKLAALPPAKDVSALEAAVSAGERQNEERIRIETANAQYDRALKKIGEAKRRADELTEKIEAIDKAKVEALAAAKFPFPGMVIDEALGIMVPGDGGLVPYDQRNKATRVRIAVAILARLAPKLRAAKVDGTVFDLPTLHAFLDACREEQIQPLVEVIRTDIPASVVFEKGDVARTVPAAPERAS